MVWVKRAKPCDPEAFRIERDGVGGGVLRQAIVGAFDDRRKRFGIGSWRCARRRGKRFAYASNAMGDFRNRLAGDDEAVIGENENVRVLRQLFGNRMGKR